MFTATIHGTITHTTGHRIYNLVDPSEPMSGGALNNVPALDNVDFLTVGNLVLVARLANGNGVIVGRIAA